MIQINIPSGTTKVTTQAAYQYDYGQVLRITGANVPSSCQVHFVNKTSGKAIVRLGDPVDGGLETTIPDELLESEHTINAFIYVLGEGTGQTVIHIETPVIARAEPEGHIDPITPSAQTQLEQMIAAINGSLERNEELVETSTAQVKTSTEQVATATALYEGIKEVERAYIEIPAHETTYLEVGKKYKITDHRNYGDDWEIAIKYVYEQDYRANYTYPEVIFELPEYDAAKPYVYVELTDVIIEQSAWGWAININYKINGEAKNYYYDTHDQDAVIYKITNPYRVDNPTQIYEVNEGAGVIMKHAVPEPPETNGTYTLKATVNNGAITYKWEG